MIGQVAVWTSDAGKPPIHGRRQWVCVVSICCWLDRTRRPKLKALVGKIVEDVVTVNQSGEEFPFNLACEGLRATRTLGRL